MKPLRVAIDARIERGSAGGTETLVLGLAQGFAELAPEDLELTFVIYEGTQDWLRDQVGPRATLRQVKRRRSVAAVSGRARLYAYRRRGLSLTLAPIRDRTMDSLGADVAHFPSQSSRYTRTPFIYHPHDLQHRHLPEFFSARERVSRDVKYGDMCLRSAAVAVGTSWVKDDVVSELGVSPTKVHVVPLAPFASPPHSVGVDSEKRMLLPARYILYPAANWPHKNHLRLFRAVAALRSRGIVVPLVLTGSRTAGGVDLEDLMRSTGAEGLVQHLGYLSPDELQNVVHSATAMVIPTLFEAASFPIWEAFQSRVPVACSNVTSLPRQVQNAALVFDPYDVDAIADAIASIWHDGRLRDELTARGEARVGEFTWERTARHFLALYRLVAGRPTSEDQSVLSMEPAL